jgi:TRAP-type C4-dicarboxylate transport system permease small subunit
MSDSTMNGPGDNPGVSPGQSAVDGQDTVTRLTNVLSTISAFWALSLAGIILWDIIGRGAFGKPFLGTHEIVGNSIVGILFLELPSTIKRGAMLRTVFIFDAVSVFWKRVIDSASYLCGIALFAAIIFGGWGTMIVSWQILEFEGAGAFEVPIYPVRTLIIAFSIICTLVYTQLLYQTVTGRIRPGKP